jgi:signal peptidase I
MIRWIQQRRLRKMTRRLLHEARHVRHMREDIADADALARCAEAEAALRQARKKGDVSAIESAAEQLSNAMDALAPPRSHPKLRENLEVLLVALVVAMGVRTYFVQPFKIPTGSMQPTLHGITVTAQQGRQWFDYFPINLVRLVLFGERYKEIRARADGRVDHRFEESDEAFRIYISGVAHEIPRQMALYIRPGLSTVRKGDVIASGRTRLGDHILVNKVRYNFSRPQRGDIFVFSTKGIVYPQIRTDSFYIKRIAGLPGEVISLNPPYLLANGIPITEPDPFARLQQRNLGYNGYQLPKSDGRIPLALGRPGQELQLSQTQYLPLGDNTLSSLDGRYFGGVERENIVGPAFMVYWPFGKRWGFIR